MNNSKLKKLVLFAVAGIFLVGSQAALAKNDRGRGPKKPLAKNIIVMISDGWGYNQVDATSFYVYGTADGQVYHRFPVRYAMSHYMDGDSYDTEEAWSDFNYVRLGATDSAAAATTMSTGVKTYSGAIGVAPGDFPLFHALDLAEDMGKATGVVSSVEFSHATPAAFVAHNVSRNNYADIANEMIYESRADVIMGCGDPCYNDSGESTRNPTTEMCGGNYKYVGGEATYADLEDGVVVGADANGDGLPDNWEVIRSRSQFQALANGPTPDRVIGLPPVYQTLQYNRSGTLYDEPYPYYTPLIESVPTLEEMTKGALNVLDNDPDGLFLMVEGGAVDWSGHGNRSARLIEEQIDFDNAVKAVVDWVQANSNWGETLLVVTGDHETGYLCGPGSDPTWEPVVNNGAGNLPGMEWHSGSHTNSLIPFFAKGDAARLFRYFADEYDLVRGRYLDNSELGEALFLTMDPQ